MPTQREASKEEQSGPSVNMANRAVKPANVDKEKFFEEDEAEATLTSLLDLLAGACAQGCKLPSDVLDQMLCAAMDLKVASPTALRSVQFTSARHVFGATSSFCLPWRSTV